MTKKFFFLKSSIFVSFPNNINEHNIITNFGYNECVRIPVVIYKFRSKQLILSYVFRHASEIPVINYAIIFVRSLSYYRNNLIKYATRYIMHLLEIFNSKSSHRHNMYTVLKIVRNPILFI